VLYFGPQITSKLSERHFVSAHRNCQTTGEPINFRLSWSAICSNTVKCCETVKRVLSTMCLALLPALLEIVGDILNVITTVSKSVYSSHTEQRVWRGKGEKTNGEPSLSSL